MKKLIFVFFSCFCMINTVNAESHDVQAKYDVSYNNEVYIINLNNNKNIINIDNYSIEFSSDDKIDVVIIKRENDEKKYAKSFTNIDNNYFVMFYKNGLKVTESNVNVSIKTIDKSVCVYDNYGNFLSISDDVISLDKNDYIFTFVDIPQKMEDYVVTKINSLIFDLNNIGLNDSSSVLIYNNQNNLIGNNNKLGTGYKILVKNYNIVNEYKIVVSGDTTGDANINLNDVTRLYHYYKKIEKMDDVFVLAGDVASNGIINLNDVTKIYHFYKNIISEF